MSQTVKVVLAASGSLALLLGAFAFQHLGGLAPCKMCIWQRYPHVAAIALGALFFFVPTPVLIALGALAALATAGVGLYHVGVELKWWEGPASCSGGNVGNLSADDLFNQIMSAPMVRCDDIAWSLGGISMAGWNAIFSLALAALWLSALKRS